MAENYILLERIELNASAASVTFANIPQSGYTDLKVVVGARSDQTDFAVTDIYASFNGVNTNQTQRNLRGYGGASGSVTSQTRTDVLVGNMPSATNTTSTFSNTEMYIPNYTSSNYKSISVDGVSESNTTGTYDWWLNLGANLWSATAAITSITLTPSGGWSFQTYSTFSLYGLAAVGTTPVIAPKASGGNITTDGTYWIHTFESSGTFTPATNLTCDYLVVAGGGAGGYDRGGGGGAGGLRSATATQFTSNTNYVVTVGAGAASTTSDTLGASGSNSSFNSISASGGGGGGSNNSRNGAAGGCGGGASGSQNGGSGGAGNSGSYSPVEGYAGGSSAGSGSSSFGGGGGGAGAVGSNAATSTGGVGVNWQSIGTYYAGGGAGNPASGATISGGLGGGGSSPASGSGTAGTVNTGGGGGGASGSGGTGGAGGSGIVIIRYAMA